MGILKTQDYYLKYDILTNILSMYESESKAQQHQQLTSIEIRTGFNSVLDFDKVKNNNFIHKNEDVIKYINENSLSHILSYSILCRKDFFSRAINHKDIMEALFNKMKINLDQVPFLFPKAGATTVFDTCEPWMITHFITIMIARDLRGLLYN